MGRFAEHANLNKEGIVRLDEVGVYAVIANRELHEQGAATKFAVANTEESWVDSVHFDRSEALHTSQLLSQQ